MEVRIRGIFAWAREEARRWAEEPPERMRLVEGWEWERRRSWDISYWGCVNLR